MDFDVSAPPVTDVKEDPTSLFLGLAHPMCPDGGKAVHVYLIIHDRLIQPRFGQGNHADVPEGPFQPAPGV